MIDEIVLYGAIAGAQCAVLGVLTSVPPVSLSVFQKREEGEYQQAIIKDMFFRGNAWELDITGLTPGTRYTFYVSNGLITSNELEVVTDFLGRVNCNFGYVNLSGDTEVAWEPTPEQEAIAQAINQEFIEILTAIGYQSGKTKYDMAIPSFVPTLNWMSDSSPVSTRLNNEVFVSLGNDSGTNLNNVIHEFRHQFLFTPSSKKISYATQNPEYSQYINVENFRDVASFFFLNDSQGDVYVFYGENSCSDTHYLYDYFLLKSLTKNISKVVFWEGDVPKAFMNILF